jgi:hypothetical protein
MSSIPGLIGVQAAQQGAVATEIAFAVAAKQQDALQAQGEAVVQLLEAAANLSKAIGRGHRLDAQG